MDHQPLEYICLEIQKILIDKNQTLSTAESCTGGRIASAITAIPGSSGHFQGGIVAYQNEIKISVLHVSAKTIDEHDVVSEDVVREMVLGACNFFNTDYAIATSGYAGPGGGSEKVPQGTICIALGNASHIHSFCIQNDNGRIENVDNATYQALNAFLTYLKSLHS